MALNYEKEAFYVTVARGLPGRFPAARASKRSTSPPGSTDTARPAFDPVTPQSYEPSVTPSVTILIDVKHRHTYHLLVHASGPEATPAGPTGSMILARRAGEYASSLVAAQLGRVPSCQRQCPIHRRSTKSTRSGTFWHLHLQGDGATIAPWCSHVESTATMRRPPR